MKNWFLFDRYKINSNSPSKIIRNHIWINKKENFAFGNPDPWITLDRWQYLYASSGCERKLKERKKEKKQNGNQKFDSLLTFASWVKQRKFFLFRIYFSIPSSLSLLSSFDLSFTLSEASNEFEIIWNWSNFISWWDEMT